jgi:Predicted membrane protein (DUF2142)
MPLRPIPGRAPPMREREIHQAGRLGWLVAGLALLLAAWAVGNAPFASPDEAQHFIRAASLVRGDLVGGPPTSPTAPATGRELARLAWQRKTTRTVTIPARLDPVGLGCNALYPDVPATCSQAATGSGAIAVESSVATYDPLPYVAPGLATLVVTSSATAALRAARLAAAALALALLTLGLSAAGGGFWSRLGLCLALTPGGLFVLSGVGANSLEIAGACALSLALFRFCVTRVASRRLLVAMAVGGFAMAASRPTSVIWLVVGVAVAALCAERPRELLATRGARAVAGVWVAGILVSAAWNLSVEPSPPHDLSRASVRDSVDFLPELLREWVGVFGSLDTRPSPWLALPIAGALAALLVWACTRCGPRVRVGVALLVLAAVVLPLTLDATVLWFTGFALQGRHVMALAVMAPILAGIALDARGAAAPRGARWSFAGVWAATQVAYWLFNAHRHAVGEAGSWSFLGDQPAWLPGPWVLWLAVTVLGAATAACALAASPSSPRDPSLPA